MPSAVGYQPTLLSEMGQMQERITSTRRDRSHPSRRFTCRPTTTPIPRPRRRSRTSTRTTNLSRAISELGIYPAVDPLASTSRILDPRILGDEHYGVARQVKQVLQRYNLPGHHRDSRHRRAVGRRQARRVARAQDSEVPVAAVLRRSAVYRRRRQVRDDRRDDPGLQEVVEGKHDEIPEQDFFLAGTIDDVIEVQKRKSA
jgi:F-type H+-transporting ATPase subunit beta